MGTRVVFMGTPAFALPSLEGLISDDRFAVRAIVTQPDRPAGRGRESTPSPVKALAQEYGIAVLQPKRLRGNHEVLDALRDLAPSVIVVAAYGVILPTDVLELPLHGCVNVHASLLPKYRGAAPVAAAILEGEVETGVTIMLMDEQMDHGPILAQRTTPIHRTPKRQPDTRGTLTARLAELGADLLLETLPRWLAGDIEPRPQLHDEATYAYMLRKESGEIDWTQPADRIVRMTRAFDPWPGAFTYLDGQLLKVLRASQAAAGPVPSVADIAPGTVIETDQGVAVVAGTPSTSPSTPPIPSDVVGSSSSTSSNCLWRGGAVLLEEVQLAGKRAMDIEAFLRGQRDFVGSLLGREATCESA